MGLHRSCLLGRLFCRGLHWRQRVRARSVRDAAYCGQLSRVGRVSAHRPGLDITWLVNSLAHVWGSQRYDTGECSRTNLFVGYVSNGEGGHNNRRFPIGPSWSRLVGTDVTCLIIRLLGAVGIAKRIAVPRPELMTAGREPGKVVPAGRCDKF